MIPPEIRCVTFDIGETLVDETRMWSELAQRLGVTPLTLCSVLGALIATGRHHHDLWEVLGVDRPALSIDPGQEIYIPMLWSVLMPCAGRG